MIPRALAPPVAAYAHGMRDRRPNEISAGGVLARRKSTGWEVCLVRAKRYWGLPKGHVERGESAQDAALREIAEECGIDPQVLEVVALLPSSDYVYRRAGRLMFKRVEHFLVTAPAGTEAVPQPGEIDELLWLDVDGAIDLASFDDTRVALQAAVEILARDDHTGHP